MISFNHQRFQFIFILKLTKELEDGTYDPEAAVSLEGVDVSGAEIPPSLDQHEVLPRLDGVLVVTHGNVTSTNQHLASRGRPVCGRVATWRRTDWLFG